MRKIFIGLFIFILFGAGCNNFEPELTRIDVQKMTEEGINDGEEQIIASKERLIKIQKSLKKSNGLQGLRLKCPGERMY